jgi:hypothetical protein
MAYGQLRQLFAGDGTPLHHPVSYLGVADLAAAAARADRHQHALTGQPPRSGGREQD